MKDYINRLARGIFIYNTPQLSLPFENLKQQLFEGEIHELTLEITASAQVKGLIYSTNERVILNTHEFNGTSICIKYRVNTFGCQSGDIIEGSFIIVSSAQEHTMDYSFKVTDRCLPTSEGSISSFSDFTKLYRNCPKEAKKIFLDSDFTAILKNEDDSLKSLYRLLVHSSDIYEGIEELLVTAKRKDPIDIYVEEGEIKVVAPLADEKITLELRTSNWGYVKATLECDSEFVELEKTEIDGFDFAANRYDLGVIIHVNKLHAGNNYAAVTIRYSNKCVTVNVVVCNGEKQEKDEHKNALILLTLEYLSFRMKKKGMQEWIEASNRILDRIRGIDQENAYFKLLQAQMYFMQDRKEEGEWLLESAKDDIFENIDSNVELYCYYLYVNSLNAKSEEYTAYAVKIISKYYENGYDTYILLWFLFYLDANKYQNKSIKLARIKEMYKKGCSSVLMYMEALAIFNSQPVLFRIINSFEYQIINFGCKHSCISKDLALQVSSVIAKEKVADLKYITILEAFYKLYEEDDILSVLVSQLIRNELKGSKYFQYYQKAVLRELRITRLYENYMQSLDKTSKAPLPKIVLMYFMYDSNLELEAKSYLYANIIANKKLYPDVGANYAPQIEKFVYNQMVQAHINPWLEIVYRHIWSSQMVNEDTIGFMSDYLFTYKVTLFDSDIVRVHVKHKELNAERQYDVVAGVSYIQIFTEGAGVCFECTDGSLIRGRVQYELERLLEDEETYNKLEKIVDSTGYYLYKYEQSTKNNVWDEQTALNLHSLKKRNVLTEETVKKVNSWLINYYYSNYSGEEFAERLKDINRDGLCNSDSCKLIEACITHGQYEDAYELAKEYGYQSIASDRLFRLIKHLYGIEVYRKTQLFIDMCACSFFAGKYDKDILEVMTASFNGNNEQMYSVWKAAQGFDVDGYYIAERIIAQMLFTGEHNGQLTEVFKYYEGLGGNPRLIEAYVSYQCYRYCIKHKTANDIVFEVLERILKEDFTLPDICKLGLLQYYAGKPVDKLNDEQLCMADKIIKDMCSQNKLFPVFKKFDGILLLPYNIIDKTIVQYEAPADIRVEIHYRFANELKEHTRILKCNASGAYTCPFTLFYGDNIQYYFTEEFNSQIRKSETHTLIMNQINMDNTNGRFEFINDSLASRELHDFVTLRKLMHEYSVNEYLSKQIFKPL